MTLEQAWDTSMAIGQGFWDEAPYIRAGDRWILDPDGWLARVPLNVWKTVRIDFDGAQTFTLSIDGTPVTTAQWAPNYGLANDWQLVIGNFDGDVDSVKITAGDGGGPPVDTTPPSVTLAAPTSSTTSPIPFSITFSEEISGLSAGDFVVTNGNLASLSGSGATFSSVVGGNSCGAGHGAIACGVGDRCGGKSEPGFEHHFDHLSASRQRRRRL